MQEQRDGLRHGLAELIERVLPMLNLMVLLLPLMLFGVELAARSAIAVTLPDTSPDVASLDTPPVPRQHALAAGDQKRTNEMPTVEARSESEPPATGTSVFSHSPLGYGE